ncbi:predicted protein [Nematostella vectensis]|uniref:Disease resistance R13L4/SHOC-2-like LRR domain-containing protein n=1 Tax=Nematostella vectensis TaxID=45351 RepID=A7RSI5_NEMVE|nr:predicted protein [Nematostella vectensis]|eukprot:XP_001637633.1 predicted protein [Nematostella vectensis]
MALPSRVNTYKYSFFTQSIPMWNSLPETVVKAKDLTAFKAGFKETESLLEKAIGQGHKILNLSHRELTVIPDSLKKLKHVQILLLNDNQIIMPPVELVYLSRLRELCLDHNQLTLLPSGFGRLTNLKVLCLSHNNLGYLASEICELVQLEELWIINTQLMALPADICRLKLLKKLSAGKNMITSLPDKISGLVSLQWLSLRENHLSSLPSEFFKLPKLAHLDLNMNKFEEFPENLIGLVSLECLSLRGNCIKSLADNCVEGLPKLCKVDIRDNQVTLLPRQLEKLRIFVTAQSHECGDPHQEDNGLEVNVRKKLRQWTK